MGNVIKADMEIKLNSQHYDFVQCEEEDDCKIILQQFENEEDLVYLVLNGVQVTIPTEDLKAAVDSMKERKDNKEQEKKNLIEIEILKKKLEIESMKLKEMEK